MKTTKKMGVVFFITISSWCHTSRVPGFLFEVIIKNKITDYILSHDLFSPRL